MKHLLQNWMTTAGWAKLSRSTLFRLALLSAFVLFVLFKIALPLFVSTASIKTNMEEALSSWTGGRASIAGAPTISFWPHPRLTLHDVTIVSEGHLPQLMAKADAITADFDVVAALRGTPVFYDFRLLAPVFRVEQMKDGALNWRRAGWMADAVRSEPDRRPVFSQNAPIGDITIENGAIDLVDQSSSNTYRVTDLSGTVAWPTPSERIRAELSAVVKGEVINLTFACDEPLSFFSGLSTPISVALGAAPVTFTFDGAGSLSTSAFFSGQSSFSAPSIPALLRWAGMDIANAATLGAVSMEAAMTIGGQALKLDNLAMTVGGANATGVLDIALSAGLGPRIGGTLAFDRLDLNSLVSTVSAASPGSSGMIAALDTAFLQWLRLDLRLSAQQAVVGPVTLTNLAAGAMVGGGRASFDIGDSGYSGGSLSGRFAIFDQGGKGGGELAVSLKGADFGPVASQFGLEGPILIGRGNLSLEVSTDQPLRATAIPNLSGRLRLSMDDGMLVNFNEPAFETLVGKDAFFNISDVAAGAFSFSTADIEATFKGGVADLIRADIVGSEKVLSLAGRIPYATGSLALAGVLKPADPQAVTPALRFFVGGSWPSPVISPLSVLIRP